MKFDGTVLDLSRSGMQFFAGISPLISNGYNDYALPVKLFDYIGLGLPILATKCTEQKLFIENYLVGRVADDTSSSLATALSELFNNAVQMDAYHVNVLTDRSTKHSWESRASKVIGETRR